MVSVEYSDQRTNSTAQEPLPACKCRACVEEVDNHSIRAVHKKTNKRRKVTNHREEARSINRYTSCCAVRLVHTVAGNADLEAPWTVHASRYYSNESMVPHGRRGPQPPKWWRHAWFLMKLVFNRVLYMLAMRPTCQQCYFNGVFVGIWDVHCQWETHLNTSS